MVAFRKDYAAPTGLDFILVWGSTNMPRLMALVVTAGKDWPCASTPAAAAKGSLGWTNGAKRA